MPTLIIPVLEKKTFNFVFWKKIFQDLIPYRYIASIAVDPDCVWSYNSLTMWTIENLINCVIWARNIGFAGVPVIVNVSMYITNLGAIDETKMVSGLISVVKLRYTVDFSCCFVSYFLSWLPVAVRVLLKLSTIQGSQYCQLCFGCGIKNELDK